MIKLVHRRLHIRRTIRNDLQKQVCATEVDTEYIKTMSMLFLEYVSSLFICLCATLVQDIVVKTFNTAGTSTTKS